MQKLSCRESRLIAFGMSVKYDKICTLRCCMSKRLQNVKTQSLSEASDLLQRNSRRRSVAMASFERGLLYIFDFIQSTLTCLVLGTSCTGPATAMRVDE